ncbi:MAG TPA: ribonuclease HII [Verrucomicrobiae bacterium]|jgi:ribonuclease HII|nr:ribonuclease HII [Verrucomicrobiae bacterium]
MLSGKLKIIMIVGIDEVGRGCWAGPVVAGAVILGQPIAGLTDSKRLTKKQRERLAVIIQAKALAVGLGWASPSEVDSLGLTAAVALAMRRALEELAASYDEIIIDGNFNFLPDNPKARAVVKADASVPAVSAASIAAKVARDNFMARIAAKYPEYGFEQHVGYGTALHLQKLKLHGITELHRRSYKPIQALASL